ncbi:transcriptional regulator [Grimontia sp. AD028]|uniref:Heme exporter protein D n=2 Tax=Grimontia TaxID=246861 RepID=A0A128ET48_9GAMM|nr:MULTISPECIES: heme exporter protein CcmD [Grimontia]EOD80159.1 Cytochrome c-type biogenesis protein CcmD, interacts with CcmCE [Grimontia indica]KKD62187.1 transcriptional regulator [Grimontia sp. AD028]CZF77231.1 Heme exporter protein D (CcmD) [Grimontia marina]
MHFDSFSEFLAMGGYAGYVWGAFGITFVAMAWVALATRFTRRKLFKEIKNKVAREQRIKNAQKMENTL